jgi:uncharacterized protein involved in response to NO
MLLAALEIPVWAALYRGRPELAPWHAHEMLFGYALAVVAGFLVARLEWRLVVALATAWLIGRVAMPIGLSAVAAVAALGFALGLAAVAARRFLRAARKGRNRMFAVMLIGMGAAEALFQAGASGMIGDGEWRGILLMLDLLTLIMLQMGGRIIPAATAGALQRRGMALQNRVQPRVETALGTGMVAMILADQLPSVSALVGVAAGVTATLAGFRLLRWRGWIIWRQPDLFALHIGYLWLVVGLGLRAAAALLPEVPMMAGVHAISIGALGTLTTTMMLRTGAARGAEHIPSARIGVMAALVTIAALLRIFSASTGSPVGILVAAVCWTLALLVALSAILPSGSCCSHSSVKRPAANPR